MIDRSQPRTSPTRDPQAASAQAGPALPRRPRRLTPRAMTSQLTTTPRRATTPLLATTPRRRRALLLAAAIGATLLPPGAAAQAGLAPAGPAQPDLAQVGMAQVGPAQAGLPHADPAQPGPAQAGLAHADPAQPGPAGAQGGLPAARAVRTREAMRVDARLEEAVWRSAPAITQFTQVEPLEGQPVSQPTVVRLAYDDVALYVAAWLYDTLPVQRRLARRDAWLEDSDWFSIALDSYDDRLTAYRFMVNPAGVRSDEVLSGGDADYGDESWDPVWTAATAVTDSGWVAELRIPFSQLRFSRARVQEWGVQLERTIARLQEEAVFSFTPRRERGGIARYGRLQGLADLDPGRGFELLPYVVTRGEYRPVQQSAGASFGNPFDDGSTVVFNIGADIKYRLASNITLDATVNPDFGQVEVDPAVINLSAFETRFDEKRPFFVEGSDIFAFGGETQPVYWRRIGAMPSVRSPSGAVYGDVPESATILGAAKLTGRSARGWMFGLTEAVTAEERAEYAFSDGTRTTQVVAPLTNYAIGRVERSLREGQTVLGLLGTAVHRRLGGTALGSTLRANAYALGADFTHEWAERTWAVNVNVAASRIAGESAVMLAAQRSSARYWQRPDATHLELDSTATALLGYTADISLRKQAGEHWRGSAGLRAVSPGFEINDLGFQHDADRIEAELELEYVQQQPGEVLREWNVELRQDVAWNYGGDRGGVEVSIDGWAQLLNYWSGHLDIERSFAGCDDRLTRGGPLVRAPGETEVRAGIESDSRRRWVASLFGSWGRSDDGAWGAGVELELELRPSAAWSISFGPEYLYGQENAQYVGTVSDVLATRTYGRRYLFAGLEQQELSLETRLNVTFRPGLSLELYAQPLIASGAFHGVKELAAPRTYDFLEYGRDVGSMEQSGREFEIDPDGAGPASRFTIDDEDFNERSLRGNAVLRWEWRPGSTLFLVWQQLREHEEWRDDLALGRSVRALFRAPAHNVLMLKATYWLPR